MKFKFRDAKTGKVFPGIEYARSYFCNYLNFGACKKCPVGSHINGTNCGCFAFCRADPEKAAKLMGYEVIGELTEPELCTLDDTPTEWRNLKWRSIDEFKTKEVNMEKKDKPRLAEVLGVEVGERFTMRDGNIELPGLYVEKDGTLYERDGTCTSGGVYSFLINHPESIIRAPRLTEAELVICKAVGAKYIARDKDSPWVTLHLEKPEPLSTGCYSFKGYIGTLDENLFPSVALGDCICVEEADT